MIFLILVVLIGLFIWRVIYWRHHPTRGHDNLKYARQALNSDNNHKLVRSSHSREQGSSNLADSQSQDDNIATLPFSSVEQGAFDSAHQLINQLPVNNFQSIKMGNDAFSQKYLQDYDWSSLIKQSYQLWRSSQRVWSSLLASNLGPSMRAKLPDRLPKAFFTQLKAFDADCNRMQIGNRGEQRVMQHLQNANLHGYARILTDVNLPFRYHAGDPVKQNQIDVLLVSTHGLFAFEIKNYQARSVSIEDINGIRNLYYQHKPEFLDPSYMVSRLIKRNNTKSEYIVYRTLQNQYVVADAKFNSIGFQTQHHRYALDRAVGHLLHTWGIDAMKTIHSPAVYVGPQVGNIYNHSYYHRVQIYLANQLANRLFHRYPRQVLIPDQVDTICDRLKRISAQESQRPRVVISVTPTQYQASLSQWRTQLTHLQAAVKDLLGG